MRCGSRWIAVAVLMPALLAGGCVFRELREQQQQLDQLCLISGTIGGPANRSPRVVLLLRKDPASFHIVDHFVAEADGRWLMLAQPGTYALAAFNDRSGDFVYQPGEPVLNADSTPEVQCEPGSRITDRDLRIPSDGGRAFNHDVDIAALRARAPQEQITASLSRFTSAGIVTTLDDPRFSAENIKSGMWAPYDFLLNAGPGVYFLQPYDPAKTPVLFVHGIDGSPKDFRYLVEHLDRSRFQPWVYYYPSGVRLSNAAIHLQQTMLQLELRFRVRSFVVVAHSMGGLVSRGFLLRRATDATRVPLFITLSTPWGGHDAAQAGIDLAPTVVRSWYDMAPGSEYLTSLFYADATQRREMQAATQFHLLFSFRKSGSSFGESSDEVVTVASELRPEAQQEARSIRGFDETHTGILEAPEVADFVSRLLAGVAE